MNIVGNKGDLFKWRGQLWGGDCEMGVGFFGVC